MRSNFERGGSRNKGDTTVAQLSSGIWKQMRDLEKVVKPSEIEIDLRMDGIPQEAILRDKQHMKEICDKVEELKDESN